MIYEERIRQLTEMLREAANPARIILFGSRTSGQSDKRSDIDVLVVERDVKDRVAEMVRLGRIISPLRIPVDLLVVDEEAFEYWSEVPGNVYYEANKKGTALYEAA
jgi:predicted nucleotidyltransferase